MNDFVVLIPTYNESESIVSTIRELLTYNCDIFVLDDNSPDDTSGIVSRMNLSNVMIFNRTRKQGIGPAYLFGFQEALNRGYEYIVTMDADGSHQPQDLAKMMTAIKSCDVVLGTRWMPGGSVVNWPAHRRLISLFGTRYARHMLDMPYRDLTSGFRTYRASLLNKLDLSVIESNGYCFQIEMVRAASFLKARFTEIPITFIERAQGKSKMSRWIVLEAFYRVAVWGFKRALRSNADKLHYVK